MSNGLVSLVGAGPGDPELLTVKAKRRLSSADVVMFDRLVDPAILSTTRPDAKLVNVGKMPHHHRVKQTEINKMLVDYALNEENVVRLKAGDPYVLGRGGEEAQFLQANGIEFEVIPGLTSAISGLAAAGIPVTHRDFASSFHVISAHLKKENGSLDWENIAHQEGTLIFLMGMENLQLIVEELTNFGKDIHTPVAIVQWATQWRQQELIGDLDNILAKAAESTIASPSIIAVGDVVKLHDQLQQVKPLSGQRILIADNKSQKLIDSLRDHGASVVTYRRSIQKTQQIDLTKLLDFKQICFEDATNYQMFLKQLVNSGQDIRELADKQILTANTRVQNHLFGLGIKSKLLEDYDVTSLLAFVGRNKPDKLPEENFFPNYYRSVVSNENLDLTGISQLVFISSNAVDDLVDSTMVGKKSQLQNIPCLAMGEMVQKLLIQKGFTQIKLLKPKSSEVIKFLLEENEQNV
ncbi:uroporphyrinogen-III C-methyltransferase [Companilactobacillus versmoldensis]|uniref:Uroporphyrinogen-III C-methyltransferase n=1 Tax=Companilactobacillus versmoldensis DSM 14857 = KCTC 3814 TaxID=1423815 RepID=A0A0R1SKQ5_9LACO|nr:uroporphyrinogen-III C-methyltransferase [Companilactobacillus versmoldensis]KRL68228.1 uroporphyrinogen-III C-methyltransferase [Companilactobacillus versmoldensis DSM 14857 = KCTC 3814]